MFRLKDLKLRRWQVWILILVALWMIYSGVMQLKREQRGLIFNGPRDKCIVLDLEGLCDGQRF